MSNDDVAHGYGPRWWRRILVALATLYFAALIVHPPQRSILRPLAFFTEATCLFPRGSSYAIDYRLEGWSCAGRRWLPLDPRPYFPIEADDKESRFQRLGYFYQANREVMRSLDEYVMTHHASVDDAVVGSIGGIRLYKVDRPLPTVGAPVARYIYEPLTEPPQDERKDLYWTKITERRSRCGVRR